MGLVGFILALFLGLAPFSLSLTAVVLATPFLLAMKQERRDQINSDISQAIKAISRASSRPDRWAFIYFLFYSGVIIGLWLFFSPPIFKNSTITYTCFL